MGPVLVPESPAPTLVTPSPEPPDRGWGRHFPQSIMALSRQQTAITNYF